MCLLLRIYNVQRGTHQNKAWLTGLASAEFASLQAPFNTCKLGGGAIEQQISI